jgi:NitT/TauT family transport system substrate-binding protein
MNRASFSRPFVGLALLLCGVACRSKERAPRPAESTPVVAAAETIRVAIGTQDTTINCATGGPLVRELHLLEKYLPHTGRYQNAKYEIEWQNQPTGAQLNSKYLANQLDIVQMADFPSVLGATALKAAGDQVESFYIATLSGGLNGAGNAVVVPRIQRSSP